MPWLEEMSHHIKKASYTTSEVDKMIMEKIQQQTDLPRRHRLEILNRMLDKINSLLLEYELNVGQLRDSLLED